VNCIQKRQTLQWKEDDKTDRETEDRHLATAGVGSETLRDALDTAGAGAVHAVDGGLHQSAAGATDHTVKLLLAGHANLAVSNLLTHLAEGSGAGAPHAGRPEEVEGVNAGAAEQPGQVESWKVAEGEVVPLGRSQVE